MSDDPYDVLIIGAGPAGLTLGRELARRGIRIGVLERDVIGSTWRRVPEDMQVISPWWTNVLQSSMLFRHNPLTRVPARAFRDHLLAFAASARLPVQEGVDIVSLRNTGDGWTAIGRDRKTWSARRIVCATGYFSAPASPAAPFQSDGSIPTIHAAAIRDYGTFAREAAGRRLLLVGKRVTAGQLLVELHGRGCEITLSAQTPVEFRRSGIVSAIRDQLYFLYEAARMRVQPRLHANSYPAMDGGAAKQLLTSGRVRVVPRIAAIEAGQARLEDGSFIETDMVVFATGYRPSLPYLHGVCKLDDTTGLPCTEDFRVVGQNGLYLIGFDNLHNFRSRYLRGIRADARLLARIIAADTVQRRLS